LGEQKKRLSGESKENKNEIELLSKQFDIMAKSLERYHASLEESKRVLEIKVRARTRELEEMAKYLEAAVEERTKELKKRVDELEKFHKLIVGRELKMIQLKKEIAKLKGSRSKIKGRKRAKASGSKKSKKKK
jgi:nitrate/nitrite-specific signal transduction histidine kinase